MIINTQAEFDALPERFASWTTIEIRGSLSRVSKTPGNSQLIVCDSAKIGSVSGSAKIGSVSGSAKIDYVYDSAKIDYVSDSAKIDSVSGSAKIDYVSGSAKIDYVSGSAKIGSVSGSAKIGYVYGSAKIGYVYDSAKIDYVYDSAKIGSVSDSAKIDYVYDSAKIGSVYGSAKIGSVYGSAKIGSVCGKSVVEIHSVNVEIGTVALFSIIILWDIAKAKIGRIAKTAKIVKQKTAKVSNEMLGDCVRKEMGLFVFFKSVNPQTLCDFYTGKIKYAIGEMVSAPDWDADKARQCGGGLHVSPTPYEALRYNSEGKLLRVGVRKSDFVIYQGDLSKVRCKKVKVLGEYVEA